MSWMLGAQCPRPHGPSSLGTRMLCSQNLQGGGVYENLHAPVRELGEGGYQPRIHTVQSLVWGHSLSFSPQRACPLSQPRLPSGTKPVTQNRAASAQLYGFPSPASHPHSALQLLQVISAQKPSYTTPTPQILQHFNLSANSAPLPRYFTNVPLVNIAEDSCLALGISLSYSEFLTSSQTYFLFYTLDHHQHGPSTLPSEQHRTW